MGSVSEDTRPVDPECRRKGPGRRLPSGCAPEWGEDYFGHLKIFFMLFVTQVDALRDCFADLPSPGHSASLPPENARCWEAPDRKCRVVAEGEVRKSWEYVLPTDDPVWGRLELKPELWEFSDAYYKRLYFRRDGDQCIIELQAKADINQDGIWATFTKPLAYPIGGDAAMDGRSVLETYEEERPGAQKFPPEPATIPNDWIGR